MGSVKKKLTKTLRKITPKEIAPILPFVAMAVPGMQGIGMAMRYALPQLLTAAGSARTSGDINLLNQAMALAGSYAAGPASKAPTKGQIAFDKKFNPQAVEGYGVGQVDPGFTKALPKSDPVAFARARPDEFKAFMADNPAMKNTFMESFNQNIVQPFGSAINDPFSKEGLMTIGATGTAMAGGDAMRQAQKEQEEADAIAMGAIGRYRDATDALKQYFLDQRGTTTYEDIYGEGNVPDFLLAANGGRVNKNVGGLLRLLAKPAAKAFDKVKTRLSRMTDDVEIYGSSDYADDTGAAFSAFAMPKTKKGLRELNKLADEGLITKEADGAFDLGQETRMEALEELFPYMGKNLKASGAIDDINEFRNIKQLQEGSSGYGPDYGFDEILEYITRGRKAEGGLMETRAGYNMGGMGSIPQTPMVPQGMQIDGRGGGFIPMGAQEKKDDVPAMLAKNEFVMTSDAVKAAGGGSVEKGAQRMYDLMNQLEAQV